MTLLRSVYLLVVLMAPMLASAQQDQQSSAASQIDHVMQSHAAAGDFSGSVLVAREGRILYEHAFGYANLEWKIPNDLQTKFEIGSMTKQFTALLVLQYVNEDKIKLDSHLGDYLPYYRKDTASRITVRQLLDHTSGVPNFISAPGFLEGPASRTKFTVRDFAEKYCSGDLEFEPGTKFNYSNSGYFLLGAVLQQVSGKSYEQILRERIFNPLGMRTRAMRTPRPSFPIVPPGTSDPKAACGMLASMTCLFPSLPVLFTRMWVISSCGIRRCTVIACFRPACAIYFSNQICRTTDSVGEF
jgi:CubicO group peptidase (beta-lactamase class C family)